MATVVAKCYALTTYQNIGYCVLYIRYLMHMSKECEIAIFTKFAKFLLALKAHVHISIYYSINATVKVSAHVDAAVSLCENESA